MDERRTCFVIMPYGKKCDAEGNEIDFDRVYKDLLEEPIAAANLVPVRCDEITVPGSIHREMFRQIAQAHVAIVDISLLSPNVFYELGVRHALRSSVTVLIKQRGSPVPFNIHDERIIDYPSGSGTYQTAKDNIREFIQAGLNSTAADSPIFTALQDIRKDWRTERIARLEDYVYRLVRAPRKRVSVITGDIRERRDIDVWVNSENTNMQMARFYDKALSAIIRYEGALKNDNGEVIEDTIALHLRRATQGREFVTPGAIYVTESGALADTRGVKKIFHAAAVAGVPGGGYVAIAEIESIVGRALARIDQQYRSQNLRSIAFPMLGTGAGGADVLVIAPLLVREAIAYLARNPGSVVENVYLMAWNHRDLEACKLALDRSEEVEFVPRPALAQGRPLTGRDPRS